MMTGKQIFDVLLQSLKIEFCNTLQFKGIVFQDFSENEIILNIGRL